MAESFESEMAAFLTEGGERPPSTADAVQEPPRRLRRKRAAAAPAPVAEPPTRKAACKKGLLTRGVLASLNGVEAGARRCSAGAALALLSIAAVALLTLLGAERAPAPPPLRSLTLADGVQVPELLLERWLRGFPELEALYRRPDRTVLRRFAEHLAAQRAVAAVNRIGIQCRQLDGAPRRAIEVSLRLRRPALPVMLASGERAWVDEEGVVLPGILPGPDGEPLLRGYERGGRDALAEVLAVWPLLRSQLPPGFVTEIHLDHPLGTEQHGIAFRTRPGTTLIWGRVGEDRFGLNHERKLRNLVHTLRSHGDLRRVAAINVRFPEPFAIMEPIQRDG